MFCAQIEKYRKTGPQAQGDKRADRKSEQPANLTLTGENSIVYFFNCKAENWHIFTHQESTQTLENITFYSETSWIAMQYMRLVYLGWGWGRGGTVCVDNTKDFAKRGIM